MKIGNKKIPITALFLIIPFIIFATVRPPTPELINNTIAMNPDMTPEQIEQFKYEVDVSIWFIDSINGIFHTQFPYKTEMRKIDWYGLCMICWYIIIDGAYLFFKEKYSPNIFAPGLQHPATYTGDWIEKNGYIIARAGGTKAPITIEGDSAIINPKQYVHRIDEHLIYEADVISDRPIAEAPAEIKDYIRNMRRWISGIKNISVGYVRNIEIEKHPHFERTIDSKKARIDTSWFLQKNKLQNMSVETVLEVSDGETTSLTRSMSILNKSGRKQLPVKSAWGKVFK